MSNNGRTIVAACLMAFVNVPTSDKAIAAAGGQKFDGVWDVVLACASTPDGAKSYDWRFSADVKNGSVSGQYGQIGLPNSGTLTGSIRASGDAVLKMTGLTGDTSHTLGLVKPGTPFHYSASVHFDQGHGAGRRNEGRECSLDFSKR